MSFLAELKRRNVIRVAIAYVVAAWVLLQVADLVLENIEAPGWIIQAMMLFIVLGFIVAVVIAWAYELTPEGIKRERDVAHGESVTHETGRKLDRIIIGFLVVAVAYFFWEARFAEKGSDPISAQEEFDPISGVDTAPSSSAGKLDPTLSEYSDNTIAVLPFANRSRLEDDAFFTEGIHDDLLTQLAKIRDLKVISRTSVMKYRDSEKSIPEIADELQVANILEGGVQRAGQRIRINAQLIDVTNDQHLWAETFDREMTVENIFEIQSEITRQIVAAVRGEMTEEEQRNLGHAPTSNLEAYEAYLQAMSLANRADYAQDNYTEARVWADRAVALDPEFAQAWALLVGIHGQAIWIGYDNSKARYNLAAEALEKAKRYGPTLAETVAAEAEYVYRIEENFSHAVEIFRRAHALLPGDADILHRLAVAQRRTPDVEGALRSFNRALEIDPHYSRVPPTLLETLWSMDAMDRAADRIVPWISRYGDSRDLQVWRAWMYLLRGEAETARTIFDGISPSISSAYATSAVELPFMFDDLDGARAVWEIPEIQAYMSNRGNVGRREVYLGWAHVLEGNGDRARELFDEAIEKLTRLQPTANNLDGLESLLLGIAYALSGQPEEAIAAADRAVELVPEERNLLFGAWIAQGRAQVLALAGKREAALAEIERQLGTTYRFSKWQLYLDQRWDFFRDDERFNDLIRPDGVEVSAP